MSLELDGQNLLYNLAYECEDYLNQLLEICHNTKFETATIELCTEFQQRFAIWAAYLGVFARKSQCLDTRLRNLPDLQDLVARLLDILNRSLQACVNEITSQRRKVRKLKNDNGHTLGVAQTQIAALETVDDVITRLMRLGTTIRQSNSSKIDMRAENYIASQNKDSFAFLCAKAIQTLYPNASQSLKDYLSNSMTRRYARMQFSSSRRETLAVRRINLPTIEEMPSGETKTDEYLNFPTKATISPAVPHLQRAFKVGPSVSDLSSVNIQQIKGRLKLPDEASTKFSKTSSIQVKQGNYPQLPGIDGGNNTMACQWCGEPLIKQKLSETDWRQHIDRDLKPYICLSEECLTTHSAYPTFNEWYRHMEKHNRRWHQKVYLTTSWACPLCGLSNDIYNSPQTLYLHLTEIHSGEFTSIQLQAISRQSKAEQPRSFKDCLLCCFTIEESKIKDEPIVPKQQKEQQKQDTANFSNKNPERASLERHSSDLDSMLSDDSSESDNADSYQVKDQKRDLSNTIARHIAAHLQVLMLLTLRFAALQSDDGDVIDDDIKSNSADLDEMTSDASEETNLERLSHATSFVYEATKDMESESNEKIPSNLDGNAATDDAVISSKNHNFKLGLEQYDNLGVHNDADSDYIAEWLPHVTAEEEDEGTDRFYASPRVKDGPYPIPAVRPFRPSRPPAERERDEEERERSRLIVSQSSSGYDTLRMQRRTSPHSLPPTSPRMTIAEYRERPRQYSPLRSSHRDGDDAVTSKRSITSRGLSWLVDKLIGGNPSENLEILDEGGRTPL